MLVVSELCRMLIDLHKELYGIPIPVVVSTWDPPERQNTSGISYVCHKESLIEIPSEHLPSKSAPEDGDFFLILEAVTTRTFQQRHNQNPRISRSYLLHLWAVHYIWEKVQVCQEYAAKNSICWRHLLLTAKEILDCNEGKCRLPLKMVQKCLEDEYWSMWARRSETLIALTDGNENVAQWKCKRLAEIRTILYVMTNPASPGQNPLPFLKNLKHLVESKV